MNFLESMQTRYTTKEYDNSQQVSNHTIDKLKEILQLSPSSINSQPWQFTFVTNAELKNKLSEVSFHNKQRIQDCSAVIVFSRIRDVNYFEKEILTQLPEGAQDYYRQYIRQFDDAQIKTWFERQVYLSLGVLLSACANIGVDATPMEGISCADYDTILQQTDYTSVVAVAIGVRDQNDFNQPSKKPKTRRPLESVIRSI